MDKEKQIEETADILGYACPRRCDKCFQNNLCGATKLYNAGYRKIPEGSVVLSKEEYEALLLEQKRLREIVDRIPCGYELKETTRKETAREILFKLKDIIVKYRGVGCGVHPLMFDLHEIAKEFGVEL